MCAAASPLVLVCVALAACGEGPPESSADALTNGPVEPNINDSGNAY